MKVHVEISYKIENEPEIFKHIDKIITRHVYQWQNKRGYLSQEEPWQTYSRYSTMETTPENGFMEVWSNDITDISDPPNNPDDIWIEQYKIISEKSYTIEWHINTNVLRITWLQSIETLKEYKIISQIVSLLTCLNLFCPSFPTINII
jgi:hypothetical protein